jgi:hypothetical protein
MEAAGCFETSVTFFQVAWCYISEDINLGFHYRVHKSQRYYTRLIAPVSDVSITLKSMEQLVE